MYRIINLVGARPQFIKAAAISRAICIDFSGQAEEIFVHSGQHYDEDLSDVFFRELGLPAPKYHLGALKGRQNEQLDHIIHELEKVVKAEKPDAIIVYGDTTTTLAGARVATKFNVPLAHIEAGLRSYNNAMPEEFNRVKTDELSQFLFVPTGQARHNLKQEGIEHDPPNRYVLEVGDVMIDSLRIFGDEAQLGQELAEKIRGDKELILLTLHRNFNADNPEVLKTLFSSLEPLLPEFQIVFPVHPRTRAVMDGLGIKTEVTLLSPVSYFEMLALEQRASVIITDSGGVQKEACFFKKPLIILRPETEWVELLTYGVAKLCSIEVNALNSAVKSFRQFTYPSLPGVYGDGFAAQKIISSLLVGLSE